MKDKTSIGISDLLRQFIEALVEDVVVEGKPFDDKKKKYLQRYSQEEGMDYAALEKNLTDFFEVMEEWKQHGLKSSELMAKMLAKDCYISESEMEKLFSTPSKAKNQNMLNGHEYVDLGLPSGTLWATCNVGATKPEEYGGFYAWGDTHPQLPYSACNLQTYKFYKGKDYSFHDIRGNDCIKYTSIDGDGLLILEACDDAATSNWGNGWRMPTIEEWEELQDNTSNKWTIQNGVVGMLFTASNGNSLFLPAGGDCGCGDWNSEGSFGYYWSSSLREDFPNLAWNFYVHREELGTSSTGQGRFYCLSVRPVCVLSKKLNQ